MKRSILALVFAGFALGSLASAEAVVAESARHGGDTGPCVIVNDLSHSIGARDAG